MDIRIWIDYIIIIDFISTFIAIIVRRVLASAVYAICGASYAIIFKNYHIINSFLIFYKYYNIYFIKNQKEILVTLKEFFRNISSRAVYYFLCNIDTLARAEDTPEALYTCEKCIYRETVDEHNIVCPHKVISSGDDVIK